ncbi:hypothetical protein KORDIASMS9_01412 [Kordia sp. SMS9]|uniref:hypothetical protein n=1 Tax=Kordia sp. SMS9 TaxID=2282170 RepID=UPI000E0CD2C2|nr:hypothetical protein [Kordia sp. SMS9]AXG69192.1 hypothetical protein KORDIASMS9_01412 [Kordia sp. SMS9]
MVKTKFSHRVLAVFLALNFLSTIIPINQLLANNSGPTAPEASSFEPVDATDMVNLITGDLSYVLPLLNVPSPEGGYPLSLSYHAGIAMDQEASWVGLGWNLNPGAINRSVNGFPDDWGKSRVNEFFYDVGWTENFYDVGIGGRFKGGISIGLGASWGSNKAFGGSVSFGYGKTSIDLNTNYGASIKFKKGFSLGISAKSISLGHSFSQTAGDMKLGGGAKIGYNFSDNTFNGSYSNSLNYDNSLKSSVGISFSSKGTSITNGLGYGKRSASYTSSSSSLSAGDYTIKSKTKGLNLDFGAFWLKYINTEVEYSLFKRNNLYVSGTLYPYEALKVRNNLVDQNSFMDVLESGIYDETYGHTNEFLRPNHDNYSVNAQGISGNIKPNYFEEINLIQKGNKIEASLETWKEYIAPANLENDTENDINEKTYFYFDGEYSGFRRIDRTKFLKPSSVTQMNTANATQFYTQDTGNYSLTTTPDGNQIHVNNRKRSGNYVETYSNQDIRNNTTGTEFLEAKDLVRTDMNTFIDEGVGAFKITAVDGKTYHYSLPVYQFESVNKNFKDDTNEDKNFLEITKSKPYATHWLLTAITGPDFIKMDANRNYPDEGDYGYWVRFDYGKWSDGHGWRTPNNEYETIYNNNDQNYVYSYGRKQIYYLDAIKTRTHTALFVKNLRLDNNSIEIPEYTTKWTSGNFDYIANSKSFQEDKTKPFAKPGEVLYRQNNSTWTLASQDQFSGIEIEDWEARKQNLKYFDIPSGKTLRLDKILLLKNEDATYNKGAGNLTSVLDGVVYTNDIFFDILATRYGSSDMPVSLINETLYADKNIIKQFQLNQHQNVLDVSDLVLNNLEVKAVKTIDFNYDESYPLGKNSITSNASSKGRLTLSTLDFGGKSGVKLIPPYSFNYANAAESFNKDNIDIWGYNKDLADVWSLNSIQSPLGGKIQIEYENDKYTPAAAGEIVFRKDLRQYYDDLNTPRTVTIPDANGYFIIDSRQHFGIKVGDQLDFFYGCGSFDIFSGVSQLTTTRTATITEYLGGTEYRAQVSAPPNQFECDPTDGDAISITAKYNLNQEFEGGGIRVKSIKVIDENSSEYITNYNYNNGTTSYIPLKDYNLSFASELPAPGVLYEDVEVENLDANTRTNYKFEVLKKIPGTADYNLLTATMEADSHFAPPGAAYVLKVNIEDKLSRLGNLISTESYNSEGHLLSKVTNNYKDDLNADGQIGTTQESFKSMHRFTSREDLNGFRSETWRFDNTSYTKYPNVLSSLAEVSNGIENVTYYDKHDFLTGQLLESTNIGSKGNQFKIELIPAHTKYIAMGAKVDDMTNKNMLTQEAMSKTYLKVNNQWKETSIGITTWNNNWSYTNQVGLQNTPSTDDEKIWRKHKSYTWQGNLDTNGTLLGYSDTFNWNLGASQTSEWKQLSEITQYNHYSMPLETKDVNGNKVATKTGDDSSKILAVGNAGYGEMFYTGAENDSPSTATTYIDQQIKMDNGATRTNTKFHTGRSSVEIPVGGRLGAIFRENTYRTGKYKISVWVHKENNDNARIQGNAFNGEIIPAGDWVLMNHYVSFSNNTGTQFPYVTSASGIIHVDDYRIHPVSSSMSSYVYNEWDELSYILDSNNLATYFEYDNAGRLVKTSKEVVDDGSLTGGFKKISENKYHYKNN